MAGIFVAAAFILLFAGLLLSYKGKEAEKAAVPNAVAVTNIAENSGTDKLTVDIQRPVISGLGDAELQDSLNHSIEVQIETALKTAEEAADEFWRQAGEQGFEPWPYTFYAGYKLKSASSVLSLIVTTYLYDGGMGMPHTVCYNVDAEKNKMITLADLFNDDTYRQTINAVIIDEMDKDIERYVSPDEFAGVSEHTKFFISEGKLYIMFAKYEVASGMTGEPEFLIPTEEIRGLIKDEYLGIIK